MANFLTELRDKVAKMRPYIAAAFIVAFSLAPLVNSSTYKISISVSFGVVLLYLFFDIYREINQRLEGIEKKVVSKENDLLKELNKQISVIDTNIEKALKEPNPPTFSSYTDVLPHIKNEIIERLKANKPVELKIIAVSAQFTWKLLIDDTIPTLFGYGNEDPPINIDLLIVSPDCLHNWGQRKLEIDAVRTKDGVPIFLENYKKQIDKGKLSLNIREYDNMPQWHGVMINQEVLFMGRCKWKLEQIKKELEVGQREYRLFRLKDKFGGEDRISLFDNWFEAYKFRAEKIIEFKNKTITNRIQENGNS